MKDLLAKNRDFRKEILAILFALADQNSSLSNQESELRLIFSEYRFPSAVIPVSQNTELKLFLIKLWFDHVYLPGSSYLDGIKGDQNKDSISQFLSNFSEAEQLALSRFHRFLELRIEIFKKNNLGLKFLENPDLWESKFWQRLSKDALITLDDFTQSEF